jgi:hypothetical protein
MDHLDGHIELAHVGSVPTDQNDEESGQIERERLLELLPSIFAAEPIHLKYFEPPPECYRFRAQAGEIFSQFLYHTLFLVKVWINFDAYEKVFFEGARSTACGGLRLPEAIYQDLANGDSAIFKLQQVRFEVGTPFRTLAIVDIFVERDDGGPGATLRASSRMLPEHADKGKLEPYVQHCCLWIEHIGLNPDSDGLGFQDLEAFASFFRRDREVSPGCEADWEEPKYGGGEWAGVGDPSRFGRFVRFVAS